VKFVQSEKMWQGHTDTLITQTYYQFCRLVSSAITPGAELKVIGDLPFIK